MSVKSVNVAVGTLLALLLTATSYGTEKVGVSKPKTTASHTSATHATVKSTKAKAAGKKSKQGGKKHTVKQ